MTEEMDALYSNDAWELVALPCGKSPIGCRRVYTVNVGPKSDLLETLERERERERRKESFGDFSGFVDRKSLSLELKLFVSTRATHRHQK